MQWVQFGSKKEMRRETRQRSAIRALEKGGGRCEGLEGGGIRKTEEKTDGREGGKALRQKSAKDYGKLEKGRREGGKKKREGELVS